MSPKWNCFCYFYSPAFRTATAPFVASEDNDFRSFAP